MAETPFRPTSTVRQYWDNLSTAEAWAIHGKLITVEEEQAVRAAISLETKSLPEPIMVLDLASGANNLVYFSGRNYDLVSTDVSLKHLGLLPRDKRVLLDARYKLPFTADYDLVTSIFGMRYFEDQEAVISDSLRLLKTGGKLIMIDYDQTQAAAEARAFNGEELAAWVNRFLAPHKATCRNMFPGSMKVASLDLLVIEKST